MKLFSSKKRVAAIGALTAATLVGGGMAYGYWTTTGTGTGSADVAAGQINNLSFVQDPLTDMHPGDSAQTLKVTVTNADAQSAYVTSVGAYITTDTADCDGDDFLINGVSTGVAGSPTPLTWAPGDLASGGSQANGADTVQFNNKSATNQDVCKEAAVTINYVAA